MFQKTVAKAARELNSNHNCIFTKMFIFIRG